MAEELVMGSRSAKTAGRKRLSTGETFQFPEEALPGGFLGNDGMHYQGFCRYLREQVTDIERIYRAADDRCIFGTGRQTLQLCQRIHLFGVRMQ